MTCGRCRKRQAPPGYVRCNHCREITNRSKRRRRAELAQAAAKAAAEAESEMPFNEAEDIADEAWGHVRFR